MAPREVLLIACGRKQVDRLKEFRTKLNYEGHWEHFDLVEYMPQQKHSGVKHGEDGSCPRTRTSVMSQDGFQIAVQEAVACAEEHDQAVISANCEQGYHRADVWLWSCKDFLNRIVDFEGNSVFNAFAISLGTLSRDWYEVERQLNSAEKWLTNAWTLQKPAPIQYGLDAAQSKPECFDTMRSIKEFINDRFGGQWDENGDETVPPSAGEVLRSPKIQPRPPTESPHRKAFRPGATKEPTTAELPSWATFEQDASVWMLELQNAGVDQTAIKQVFLLSQH